MTLSASRLRSLLSAYVVAVALITLTFAVLNARVAHPWILGEWLINYSGGFVRRGLLGAVLLAVHQLTHLPVIALASALQITLYAAFYASLIPLLRGLRWSLPLLALLLSPATLAFTVLDPPTSVRKEVLLFLALSLLSHLTLSRRSPPWLLALLLAILSPLLLLTHEALLAFLPYLFLPLLLATPRLRGAARLAVLPILFAALAFSAAVSHPGGSREATAVCTSVGGHLDHQPGGLCGGAIAYLELSPTQARAETSRAIRFYHYRTRYPLPILLTCLPIAWLFRRRLRQPATRRSAQLLLALTALSLIASLPLFVIARDWGRWMEIHATCLLVLFLLLEHASLDHSPTPATAPAALLPAALLPAALSPAPYPATPRSSTTPLTLTPWSLFGLLLYSTCWTLPAVGIFPGRFGYIDLVRYLHSYRSQPHLSPRPPSLLPPVP